MAMKNIKENFKELKNNLKNKYQSLNSNQKKYINLGGLATLIIGGALIVKNPENKNPQEQFEPQREYVGGTIHNTEYLDNKADRNNYLLEAQVLFKGKKDQERVYFFKENADLDKGELNFVMIPFKESTIWGSFNSNETELTGQEYIPTKMSCQGKTITAFEITDSELNAELSRKLIKRKNVGSESSFGYNFEINDEDFKKRLPQENIIGSEYLYFKKARGNFLGKKLEKIATKNINNSLPEIFVPLTENTKYAIHPQTGNILIYSPEGFYLPIQEKNQTDKEGINNSQPNSVNTPIHVQDSTDYMKHKAEQERLREEFEKAVKDDPSLIK